MNAHFRAVAAVMDDPELPVRVQSALALTEMVTTHEQGTSASRTFPDYPTQIFCLRSEGGGGAPSRQGHSR